jgi:hypothetical protein
MGLGVGKDRRGEDRRGEDERARGMEGVEGDGQALQCALSCELDHRYG